MGNCQAIDNATLAIQHPNGKVDHLHFPVTAAEIIKTNPGHYVALLLTTTLYSSSAAAPLRVTRIKLLRPTDTLLLGHVYRLLTSQEVMKGLWAKKQSKINGSRKEKQTSDFEGVFKEGIDGEKSNNQVKQERQRSRKSGASKARAWQPALKSISEAAT